MNCRGSLRSRAVMAVALFGLLASSPALADLAQMAGSYAGTYEATDPAVEHGTWSATVAGDGTVTGAARSEVAGRDFEITGSVAEDGEMAMSTGSISSGSTFTGTIADDGTVTGTWSNAAAPDRYSGTFEGERE